MFQNSEPSDLPLGKWDTTQDSFENLFFQKALATFSIFFLILPNLYCKSKFWDAKTKFLKRFPKRRPAVSPFLLLVWACKGGALEQVHLCLPDKSYGRGPLGGDSPVEVPSKEYAFMSMWEFLYVSKLTFPKILPFGNSKPFLKFQVLAMRNT